MQTLELEVFLPVDTALVWDQIHRTRLWVYVSEGLISFVPINPDRFPERWTSDRYRVRKYLFGVLPIGWQDISIELLPDQGPTHRLRDNGCGWLIPRWDHTIEVEPVDGGTHYVDRVKLEAGILTPLVAAFARRFFKHRQQRWKKLVASGFDYAAS